ncbi:hypothetical protein COU77_01070 [Candidatus Peregrinibacteria bacterium CG10_big_fil_rev_8_21_14_0_10_49_16]|nr:MAG: hypothetical protein COU77_01070 [Candidatus Peregrinibacteria bacterium CG10_big_fil_rev_8_21_14_0_10_49_16]
MAVVAMQKVAVLAHSSLRETLIDLLHEQGVMEIIEGEGVQESSVEVNFRRAELEFAIEVLKKYAPKHALQISDALLTKEQVVHAALHTDVRGIIDRLHELSEEDAKADRLIQEQHQLRQILEPWKLLKLSLDESRETTSTVLFFGSVLTEQYAGSLEELELQGVRADVQAVHTAPDSTCFSVLLWKEDRDRFEECGSRFGWNEVELPVVAGTPKTILQNASLQEKVLMRTKETHEEERTKLAVELPQLLLAQVYMRWLEERYRVRASLDEGWGSFVLTGWVPRIRLASLERALHETHPAVEVIRLQPKEGEQPPVLLKNLPYVTPFQSVTTLYGLPLPSEFDPTAALSPFFALYFALCLTDAGYGLVIALLFGTALLKLRKTVEEAPLLWLLCISGVVTFFVSIPFGGWFGLLPEQVPTVLTKQAADGTLLFKGQIWNLSQQSGITFLQNLALTLGLTHLFFGIFLAGWHKWIHGKKIAAFWQDFTSHILLGAVLLRFLAPDMLVDSAQYVLYIAIVLMIWGKGYGAKWYVRPLMGLLGVVNFAISMLSNVLSYLRILALGLVTGALALAVNQVAVELGNLFPLWIAIPTIIVVAFCGHLVSIALNTLGSFIHSGRLQFIEFFSQFFEGGGREFRPFRRSYYQ